MAILVKKNHIVYKILFHLYSGYALYISVTIFCNSLPLKTYAAKMCESLGKNKKIWKMNIIDDLQSTRNSKFKLNLTQRVTGSLVYLYISCHAFSNFNGRKLASSNYGWVMPYPVYELQEEAGFFLMV